MAGGYSGSGGDSGAGRLAQGVSPRHAAVAPRARLDAAIGFPEATGRPIDFAFPLPSAAAPHGSSGQPETNLDDILTRCADGVLHVTLNPLHDTARLSAHFGRLGLVPGCVSSAETVAILKGMGPARASAAKG